MSEIPSHDELSETPPKRILSREQVLEALLRHVVGEYTVTVDESDAKGIYLLEMTVACENPGETTVYRYQRKGRFGKNQQSVTTVIQVCYLENGEPVGGYNLSTFDERTGAWGR